MKIKRNIRTKKLLPKRGDNVITPKGKAASAKLTRKEVMELLGEVCEEEQLNSNCECRGLGYVMRYIRGAPRNQSFPVACMDKQCTMGGVAVAMQFLRRRVKQDSERSQSGWAGNNPLPRVDPYGMPAYNVGRRTTSDELDDEEDD